MHGNLFFDWSKNYPFTHDLVFYGCVGGMSIQNLKISKIDGKVMDTLSLVQLTINCRLCDHK